MTFTSFFSEICVNSLQIHLSQSKIRILKMQKQI